MFGLSRHHRPSRMGMIIATIFGTFAGLCAGAGICIGILHLMAG